MKSIHEVKRTNTIITCFADESDYPTLEFYKKVFTLPFTPDPQFVGTNTDPYFLLAAEALFTESGLKINELTNFFTKEKRIDNLKKYQRGVANRPDVDDDFNADEHRFLRWRLLNNTTAWDYMMSPRGGPNTQALWDILGEEKDFYKRICLSVWCYRKLDVKSMSNAKAVQKLMELVPVEDYVEALKRYTSWYHIKGVSMLNAAFISQTYVVTPELTKIVAVQENAVRLAALAKIKTPLEQVEEELKNLPVAWAKDILES